MSDDSQKSPKFPTSAISSNPDDWKYPGYEAPPIFDEELGEAKPSLGVPESPMKTSPSEASARKGEFTPLALEQAPEGGGTGPSEGYKERWRAIARFNAMGYSNNYIARRLGYSPAAVTKALQKDWIQAEVRRYREQLDAGITEKVKDAATDGIDRIHRIINDESEKSSVVLDASKWAVEKHTGKARQEVSLENNSLTAYLELLKQIHSRGETLPAPTIDVTPEGRSPEGLDETAGANGSDAPSHTQSGPDRFANWFDAE